MEEAGKAHLRYTIIQKGGHVYVHSEWTLSSCILSQVECKLVLRNDRLLNLRDSVL